MTRCATGFWRFSACGVRSSSGRWIGGGSSWGVDGLERLYGPPERQIAGLRARLEALSPWLASSARIGYAPGKFAAWVAARSAGLAESASSARPAAIACAASTDLAAFLGPQPVEVLPVSPRMVERLKRLGVKRLGQLVRMPEPALVSQFGADGRRALAWARGLRIDHVRPETPARPIRVALDFPSPIGQLELLHAALDRLIARALEHPRRRGKSVRGLRVSASLEDGGSWSIRAIAREPTSEPERLGAFLRSRIALDRPRRAVETLRLEFFRFGPASTQTGLFDPRGKRSPCPRFAGDAERRASATPSARGAPAEAATGRRGAVPGARTRAGVTSARAASRAHGTGLSSPWPTRDRQGRSRPRGSCVRSTGRVRCGSGSAAPACP